MALLFLDLETTGLNPDKCRIIEVAAVLVDGSKEEPVVDVLVNDDEGYWESGAAEMHEKSGLMEALNQGPRVLVRDAESTIIDAITKYPMRSVVLAGNSVHFDRAFLRRKMPGLDASLHYRHMDVSCLMTFFEEHAGIERKPAMAHRAMADVRVSMAAYERLAFTVADWSSHRCG